MSERPAAPDRAPRTGSRSPLFGMGGLVERTALCALVEGFARTHAIGVRLLDVDGSSVVEVPGSGIDREATGASAIRLELQQGDEALGALILGPLSPAQRDVLPEALRCSRALELTDSDALHAAAMRGTPGLALGTLQLLRTLQALVEGGLRAREAQRQHARTAVAALEDLTERTLHLSEVNERLMALDRMKSVFLATISHELRTPLTSILGYAEMLSEGLAGPLGTEQAEYVRTIQAKGESLMGLITSVMDLTRLEDGRLRLELKPFRLHELLEDARSTLSPQAHKKGLTLELSAAAAGAVELVGDRERLKQVLVNLLANAVKFTPEGGRVVLRAAAAQEEPALGRAGIRLEVEDTGPGVPSAHAELIFQSFYQVDSTTTRAYGGAGLGLAIAKGIVEAHGGQVRLERREAPGACFSVLLPLVARAPRSDTPLPDGVRL